MNILEDFVYINNWYDKEYEKKSNTIFHRRHTTFKIALNLFLQRGHSTILETGCVREPNDFGSGYSTYIFGDICSRYNKQLVSIDNTEEHLNRCGRICANVWNHILELANNGFLMTFPFGAPGIFPGQHENITKEELGDMVSKGMALGFYNIQTSFFNNNKPWEKQPYEKIDIETASKIPINMKDGVVNCICVIVGYKDAVNLI